MYDLLDRAEDLLPRHRRFCRFGPSHMLGVVDVFRIRGFAQISPDKYGTGRNPACNNQGQ